MQHHSTIQADFVALGDDLRGYYAVPGAGPLPAVLVFQEAFGVNDYVQSEVRRLAAHGFAALAPDLFRGQTFAYGDMENVYARLRQLTDDGLLADVDESIAFLDAQPEVGEGGYGAVGFCMGGRLAFLSAAARSEKVRAAASFYGGSIAPVETKLFPPLLDRVPEINGSLLMIYGADDGSIAPQEHARLAEALSTHKCDYALRVFPGAGHGFASVDRESYRPEQAEAAWVETLALFDRTLR
jgi:carboxymethylenebutenolidase